MRSGVVTRTPFRRHHVLGRQVPRPPVGPRHLRRSVPAERADLDVRHAVVLGVHVGVDAVQPGRRTVRDDLVGPDHLGDGPRPELEAVLQVGRHDRRRVRRAAPHRAAAHGAAATAVCHGRTGRPARTGSSGHGVSMTRRSRRGVAARRRVEAPCGGRVLRADPWSDTPASTQPVRSLDSTVRGLDSTGGEVGQLGADRRARRRPTATRRRPRRRSRRPGAGSSVLGRPRECGGRRARASASSTWASRSRRWTR